MADPQNLQGLIDGFGVDPSEKDRAWTAYHTSTDSNSLQRNLDGLSLNPDQKTALWNHWHANRAAGQAASATTSLLSAPGAAAADVKAKAKGAATGAYQYLANKGVGGVLDDVGDIASGMKKSVVDFGRKAKEAYSWGFGTPEGRSTLAHEFLPLGGQIAGATMVPEAPIRAAATGAAAGETGAQLFDAITLGKVSPSGVSDAAVAGAAGGVGELIPRIPDWLRPQITHGGEAVLGTYGKTAMPHQLTQSSWLDFLYNIAESGMTGESKIWEQQAAQRGAEAGQWRGIEATMHPSLGKGNSAQAVRENAADLFTRAQQPLNKAYDQWLQGYGGLTEPGLGGMPGMDVKTMHKMRSDALERGRDALMMGDSKSAYEANRSADDLLGRIQKVVGPQGSGLYDQLSGQYRAVMEQYDNPLMRMLRKGVNPEQVADVLLNPSARFPEMTDRPGAKVSQTVPTMLQRVKSALSPDAWQQLKATTADRLYQKALKPTEDPDLFELDPMKLKAQVAKMGPGAFQTLFETSADEMTKFFDAAAYAHKATGATGKFYIALRQAAAMSAAGTAAAGIVMGSGGSHEKALTAGGAAAAATYIVAPWALSRMMTNPSMRSLFIRGLEETNPTLKAQIAAGLNKMLGAGVRGKVTDVSQSMKSKPVGPGIPEPPATARRTR